MCVDEKGASILEAFRAGCSVSEILTALSLEPSAAATKEIDNLWRFHSSDCTALETTVKTQEQHKEAALTKQNLKIDLMVHCAIETGTGMIVVSAGPRAAGEILPLVRELFETREHSCELVAEHRIVISDEPGGLFSKHVFSKANCMPVFHGNCDDVLVEMSLNISEIACDYDNHLAVLHAAALTKSGKTLLLCNPSGSGKTTLCWLLSERGFDLVHDDVVPISLDGKLIQLRTPSTLKPGSWPILSQAGLELSHREFSRLGNRVQFHPIKKRHDVLDEKKRYVVFVTYDPSLPAGLKELTSLETFQRLLGEECVIRNRSAERLTMLCDWMAACHGAELHYGNDREAAELLSDWMNLANEP